SGRATRDRHIEDTALRTNLEAADEVARQLRLREAIDELNLPDGMSLIVRTAGAQRPKPEIKKDCEYLLRLWDNIRERTFASTAPALIYEEADLIKRSIRDTYGKDVDEVVVDGEDAYNDARDFMRMLMPQHASKVRLSREPVPLFAKHGVDQQLEGMHNPTVQLKSGGYIVINQTEALVAIDVNSGRATRDRHIEDTALRTNLEAADEVARQLRLRDIDMESSKHDGMVERRLKDALKQDRARIQVGRISHFGLLEMSRQRLRPSLVEHSFVTCPHCQGRGLVRSAESSGLAVLRAIEEEGGKRRAAEIVVHVATPIAFWLLNKKRDRLAMLEERFGMTVLFQADDSLVPPALRIERT
ncbi:MAG: ribonuclease E/G, partial [Betaproteobacteria bacterium]|nr:ribonuclease E/G [Betaproteobacteria bacterium]